MEIVVAADLEQECREQAEAGDFLIDAFGKADKGGKGSTWLSTARQKCLHRWRITRPNGLEDVLLGTSPKITIGKGSGECPERPATNRDLQPSVCGNTKPDKRGHVEGICEQGEAVAHVVECGSLACHLLCQYVQESCE